MECGICKFFSKAQMPPPDEDLEGECQRFPKVPIGTAEGGGWAYPVQQKYDLCGEYQEMQP